MPLAAEISPPSIPRSGTWDWIFTTKPAIQRQLPLQSAIIRLKPHSPFPTPYSQKLGLGGRGDYSAFVAKGRELEKAIRKEYPELDRKVVLRRAIVQTIEYCKTHDILKEYLEKLTMEEQNMLAREWNLEDAIAVAKEEGIEEGWEKGGEERQKAIFTLLRQGYTLEQVEQMFAKGGTQTVTAGK